MSLMGTQLHRIETADEAAACMRWLGERRDVLACDTETKGLNWWEPDFTRLIQFGDCNTGWTVGREWFGLAREILTRYDGPVVYHNARFDMHALEVAGMPVPARHQTHDTYIMHSLLDPLGRHGLKGLATAHIDPTAGSASTMLDKAKAFGGWDWATIPEEVPAYGQYAAIDTILTARLYEKFKPQVDARYAAAYEREMGAQWVLYRAERRGIRIDSERTRRLRDDWTLDLAQLKLQLQSMGIDKPGSNQQIEDALCAAGWEPDEFTETGRAKLDKSVKERIIREHSGLAAETVRLLMDYQQKRKWRTTYLDTFLEQQDSSGFVHPDIRTMQARTGRMSVTRPAMQTLPRDAEVRGCILPYSEDDSLYMIDYMSQEARLMIHYAKETALGAVVASGEDLHCYIASQVYGEQIDKHDPRRSLAKNTLYALMYGAGPNRIAYTSGAPIGEVEKFIDMMGVSFPGIRRFMDETDTHMRTNLMHEGRASIKTWGGRDFVTEADKIYKGVNGLIQGTAADVIKEKIIALDSAGLADYLVMVVHDENMFSFPKGDEGLEMARLAKDIMEDHTFSTPLTCELSGGYANWGEHYA